MAKSKFSLALKPTFSAAVPIPVPGEGAADVYFTFKARTREQLDELVGRFSELGDVDAVMEIASGWELEDPFDRVSVEKLVQNYLGAARAVIETYLKELTQARQGN